MSAAKPKGAFSPLTMIALILVSVFSFSAFFTLLAFAPELSSGHEPRAHALSQSAVGYAGIVRLAHARGDIVSVNRLDRRANPPALTIITPERPLTADDLNSVGGQALLIVLPKWLAAPNPLHPGWVMRAGTIEAGSVASLLGPFAGKAQIARASGEATPSLSLTRIKGNQLIVEQMTPGAINQLQTIELPGIEPLATDASNHVVLGRLADWRGRAVYVLADPDFLNTQGIADIETARTGLAMLDLLHQPGDEIIFDVTLNGFGRARSVLRLAFTPPFLPATLCLFAAACLLGWRAALRAGPSAATTRAIALGKSALADSSAALIRLARREHKMGKGYAALTGASVAELIGAARKTDAENAEMLAAVGQAQGVSPRFSDLANEAAAAQPPARMLEAAKKLHAWKEEMLRATG